MLTFGQGARECAHSKELVRQHKRGALSISGRDLHSGIACSPCGNTPRKHGGKKQFQELTRPGKMETMLFGKTIIVTGCASGIGAKVAELCSSLGAEVIGVDIRPPACPAGFAFIKGDISNAAAIDELMRHLPRRFDAICNVAGLSGRDGAIPTLAVNFFGLRYLSESLATRINHGGAVINVASIAGYGWRKAVQQTALIEDLKGFPDIEKLVEKYEISGPESYRLSKELLLLWSFRAAGAELFKKREIRVNAVSPGPVETPLLEEFRDVVGDEFINRDVARVGRGAKAAEIAPLIAFLCSDGARWINGTNIPVDGGWEAVMNRETLGF